MKLSVQEKAARKAAFQSMRPTEKLDYILSYYKWTIILIIIAAFVFGSVLFRQLTKKEPVVYVGFANVVVGSELRDELTTSFLRKTQADQNRQEVYLYQDLYLSENADEIDHEYAYASGIKVTAAIQAKKMDIIIMNQESYDYLSNRGFLLDFAAAPEADEVLLSYAVSNTVITEDNAIDHLLDESVRHEVVTENSLNGIELNSLPLFRNAGFDTPVFLGVIANSPRMTDVMNYVYFLLEE